MKNLALFDFDGTITYKDTLIEFIKFYKGNKSLYLGLALLSPILILFKLKLIPNWKAKQLLLTYFFKGEPVGTFQQRADLFGRKIIPQLIRPKAMEKLNEHIKNNDHVIIVSASAENWIREWSKEMKIELIATRLETDGKTITGRLQGANCYGQEKVNRLLAHLQEKKFEKIYAYGDSNGDRQLLEFATDPHYRCF